MGNIVTQEGAFFSMMFAEHIQSHGEYVLFVCFVVSAFFRR